MRITFVSSHAKLGGAERYLEILMGELPDAWDKRVVALEHGPFVERLRSLRYQPEVIHTSRHPTGILRSAWRLRRRQLDGTDVVHANNLKAALVAGLATVGRRVPVVWVKHDFTSDGRLAHFVGRLVTRIVGVAEVVMRTFGPAFAGKVTVVHNGLPPTDVDRSTGRRTIEAEVAGGSSPIVVLVGRIHPWKGQLEIVEAAPKVLAALPDVRFVLVGGEDPTTPDYAALVRTRIEALGLKNSFHLMGQRDDALELMAGSDALVIPSVPDESGAGRDAFPFVGLEAMAVGTPVVAYSDGGLPELLGDCGRGVAPSDRDALAHAIVDVLGDTETRARMADCGKRRVKDKFSIDQMVEKMTKVYEEARR